MEAPLHSPGVGARRKGNTTLPRLPLSVFSPPGSGTAEGFPIPQSPSATHPAFITDSYLSVKNGLDGWTADAGRTTSRKINAVVLGLTSDSQSSVVKQIIEKHPSLKILSVLVPVDLNQGPPTATPIFGSNIPISLSVPFVKTSPKLVEGVKWALEKGHVVDIDVQSSAKDSKEVWQGLEELLSEVLGSSGEGNAAASGGAIVLSNLLPPPHDLGISIVKLLNHPAYRAYQDDTASLSLFPSVYVKYLPPRWDAPIPGTSSGSTEDSKEKKEWKRRIKMYLGPIVEAFGYQRILYGSSTSGSDSNDWYEIARESIAELGADQEGIDAVFETNATLVYGGA